MVSRLRTSAVVLSALTLAVVACAPEQQPDSNAALSSEVIPNPDGETTETKTSGNQTSDGENPDGETSGNESAGYETSTNQATSENQVVSEELPFVSGDGAAWDSPAGMIAAMATTIPFRQLPDTSISSISVVVAAEEEGSWQVSIDVRATAGMTADEFSALLAENPMFPRELDALSVPSDGDFGGWHRNVSMSYDPTTTPVRSLAEVSLWISGTTSADDHAVLTNDLAAPVREMIEFFDPAFARRSELTWRPETPNIIEARVWLMNDIRDRLKMAETLGLAAVPSTYLVQGDRIKATLNGDGEVAADWQPADTEDELQLVFQYPIDNGRPVPGHELVSAKPEAQSTLVDWGDRWYIDEDGFVDDGWNSAEFDTADWRKTGAPFHRQEHVGLPGATITTPENGMTTWFRKTIDVEDRSLFERLTIETLVDDGLVIWINGAEVHRWNMPAGPIEAETAAVERISGLDELLVRRVIGLPSEALVDGENVLAVEVHQATRESSDTRFDLRVVAAE